MYVEILRLELRTEQNCICIMHCMPQGALPWIQVKLWAEDSEELLDYLARGNQLRSVGGRAPIRYLVPRYYYYSNY